jgi:hypothetical protein
MSFNRIGILLGSLYMSADTFDDLSNPALIHRILVLGKSWLKHLRLRYRR